MNNNKYNKYWWASVRTIKGLIINIIACLNRLLSTIGKYKYIIILPIISLTVLFLYFFLIKTSHYTEFVNLVLTFFNDIIYGVNSSPSYLPADPKFNWLLAAYEALFIQCIQLFKFSIVEGYLDDLVGQRVFVTFLLLTMIVFIFILFITFLFNVIIILNKERILNYFTNKWILRFINLELLGSKVLLFIIPIFILWGIYTITHGLIWLLINPIPYEGLGIDLHQYVSSYSSEEVLAGGSKK